MSDKELPSASEDEDKAKNDSEGKAESKDAKVKKPKGLKFKKQKPKEWVSPHLAVTSSPHVVTKNSIKGIMWSVFIVLLPPYIWGILHFAYGLEISVDNGFSFLYDASLLQGSPLFTTLINSKPLHHLIVAVLGAMGTELIVNFFRKQRISAFDGSAAVTGILLAMMLPPHSPLFVSLISSIFAIVIIKHLFGGLGTNFLNPAIAGRVFAMVSWPSIMYAQDYYLLKGANSIASATSLETIKKYIDTSLSLKAKAELANPYSTYSLSDLFFGNSGGAIGEISVFLLSIGGIYLLIKKYVTWEIPTSYIATVFMMAYLIGDNGGEDIRFALYYILSGGLFLGAFFMATDMVTSPLTKYGQLIFGVSCGLLTILIRLYGGYPEGVAFSILIMNFFTPLIDKYTIPRVFGHKKRKTM